jgi:polysaccharide biosynthesis transport protein
VNVRQKQQSAESALAPLSIIRMLWKRKITIAALLATFCAASGLIVFKLPPLYKSEAVVLVVSQKIPEKFVSSTVSTDVSDRLATIGQQIMSTTRLLRIIHDADLYKKERKEKNQEEIVQQMRDDISLRVEKDGWTAGKPGAFRVGYQGTDPETVAQVANQLANLYVQENLQTREVQAVGTSEFIDNQLQQAKRELDEQEAKVARFKQEHNGSLPEQEDPLLSTLSNLRLQLQGAQDAINRAQQNKLMLETSIATEESQEGAIRRTVEARASTSPGTGAIPAKPETRSLADLEDHLEQLRTRYTPDYPDIVALQDEIAHLKQSRKNSAASQAASQIGEEQHSAAPPVVVSRELLQEQGKIAMLRAQLTSVNREIELQEVERERLIQSIASNQSRIELLPLVEQQMAALTRDYEGSKATYKSLLDKRGAAEMATDMERRQKSERFEIIDPARVPEKPFKPNRPLLLVLGSAASIALALLAAFGLELRKTVLLGEWELPPGVVVLGRVPPINMNAKAASVARKARRIAFSSAAVSLLVAAVMFYVLKIRS